MRVKANRVYSINKSDILVLVTNVLEESNSYQKVITVIFNKNNKNIVEGPQEYVLDMEKTRFWEDLGETSELF